MRTSTWLVAAAALLLVAGCEPSAPREPTAPAYTLAVPLGAIGDRVWIDANGDGVQDAGEAGSVGWAVTLVGPGPSVATQTTGPGGAYEFSFLQSGSYRMCVTPRPGYTPTWDPDGVSTPSCAVVNLTPGRVRTDIDFGYWQPSGIGDRLWNDANGNRAQDPGESGLVGWTVTLSGAALPTGYPATLVSGANGTYRFGDLPAGNYTVCVARQAGFTQTYDLDGLTTPNCVFFTLPPGRTRSDVDFGYRR